MSVVCHDWQACAARDAIALVAAEARAWHDQLHWHVAEAWRVVEPARVAGHLPGLIACDAAGRPVGWTAFLPHEGHLQVMAVAAPDAGVAGALVDAVLASPQALSSASTILCIRAGAPRIADVLAERGFKVDTYRYMSLEPTPGARRSDVMRSMPFEVWQGHEEAVADLCARAYRGSTGVRAFAPGGTPAEWRSYVAGLVQGTGCGWFLPELSLVAPATGSSGLEAAVMLTDLGLGTVHVAQVVVDPARQGRGTGRALLERAIDGASGLYERVTLLVASANTAAVRLYRSLGFRETADFVVAVRARAGRARGADGLRRTG